MTLVKICKHKERFVLPATGRKLSQKEITAASNEFHMSYPRESWTILSEEIKRAAQKRRISVREYNSYTENIDDLVSPIKARIQLWKIPEKLANEEEKRSNEIGINGLYEMMGY